MVSIAAKKHIEGSALIEQQKTESVNFQREMYSWMLKRKMQGNISVEIQDVETTIALLTKATGPDGKVLTPEEMCRVLGVDGILTSNYSLSKPMSEGAAIAVGLIGGTTGKTNEAIVSLSIHDSGTKKMIWNYDQKLSSSLGTPARLVDDLMRQASRKMPYFSAN
jgi:archaellum component FlaG (FlaF/FlaG flagellin family)